jgi:(R,R)-butanediol dehydrogenase / meso-butanediol dehydrogenase / diacetyl reductase
MRAGVLHAPHDLRVEDRPDPTPGENDVVIQVAYNGLCGTDVTEYGKGPMMVPLHTPHPGSGHVGPTILGHEFIGTVVDAGRAARSWLGKRVASGAGVSCGHCAWCARGRTNLCASYYTLGLSTHGGLAQLVAAPASTLVEVPDGCAETEAALAQPLAVGLHGVDRAGITPGDRVAVLGAGAIGSFLLAGLAGHDGPVAALDIDAGRLEVARTLGATETHLVDRDTTAEQLRDLVDGPVDVVVESSGVPCAAARALALAARGGRVLLVGLVKAPQEIALADVVLREVDVRTTVAHVCGTDLPKALDLLTRTPLASTIGVRVVPLGGVVDDGLAPLAAGALSGKVLVDPRHG